MYDFLKTHSNQFVAIGSDVRPYNRNSKRLHINQGFQMINIRNGEIINPKDTVHFPKGNISFEFDLQKIKNRKHLTVGTTMKLSDVEKN